MFSGLQARSPPSSRQAQSDAPRAYENGAELKVAWMRDLLFKFARYNHAVLCRLSMLLLILVAGGLHVAYFAYHCPLDLAPDEAHYWDWSRHLDWSYYSKGPLVAYLIRMSCWVAGSWSQQLTATDMLAVRLPAVVCGCLLLLS